MLLKMLQHNTLNMRSSSVLISSEFASYTILIFRLHCSFSIFERFGLVLLLVVADVADRLVHRRSSAGEFNFSKGSMRASTHET